MSAFPSCTWMLSVEKGQKKCASKVYVCMYVLDVGCGGWRVVLSLERQQCTALNSTNTTPIQIAQSATFMKRGPRQTTVWYLMYAADLCVPLGLLWVGGRIWMCVCLQMCTAAAVQLKLWMCVES